MGVSCNARFVILEDGLSDAIPYIMREDYCCLDYCHHKLQHKIAHSHYYPFKQTKTSLSRSLPTLSHFNVNSQAIFSTSLAQCQSLHHLFPRYKPKYLLPLSYNPRRTFRVERLILNLSNPSIISFPCNTPYIFLPDSSKHLCNLHTSLLHASNPLLSSLIVLVTHMAFR